MATENILRRLIEAEEDAREILKAAEEQAKETIARAQEEAKQLVEAVRQEMDGLLRGRLETAESQGAAEIKRRLEKAEADAQEFARLAKNHFSEAVEMIVDWVTNRSD
jgi:vacuolar-type H+-ATPase subunit H